MTPEDRQLLFDLAQRLSKLEKSDRYIFEKNIQIMDGRTIQGGKSVGLRINMESGQKLGFFGVTPIARRTVSTPYTAADIGTALTDYGLLNI